jgi:hypothetical protein
MRRGSKVCHNEAQACCNTGSVTGPDRTISRTGPMAKSTPHRKCPNAVGRRSASGVSQRKMASAQSRKSVRPVKCHKRRSIQAAALLPEGVEPSWASFCRTRSGSWAELGVEQAAAFRITKACHHLLGQHHRIFQPVYFTCAFVKRQQGICEQGVVVQEGGNFR